MTGAERPGRQSLSRRFFGRPTVWVAGLWCAVGLLWLVLAVADPSAFRFSVAGVWLFGGVGMLVVALRDRAAGRAARPFPAPDQTRAPGHRR